VTRRLLAGGLAAALLASGALAAPPAPASASPPTAGLATLALAPSATTTVFDPDTPTSPPAGTEVPLTVVVEAPGAGTPEGSIQFVELGPDDAETELATLPADALAGHDDSATASYDVNHPDTTAVTYLARFVPDDPDELDASETDPLTMTPVQREVVVDVDVPTDPVVRGEDAEVTVTATYGVGGPPVDAATTGTLSTVTLNGDEVDDVDWEDGVAELDLPTTAGGTHTVEVAFVPDDGAIYATPDAVDETFEVTRPTATTLAPATSAVAPGDSVTLTASVTTATAGLSAGDGLPVGRVELFSVLAGVETPVDDDAVAAVSGPDADHTATTTFIVEPTTAGSTSYLARFVPTSAAAHLGSDSAAATVTATQQDVDLDIDVPTTTVPTGDEQTVTVTATHGSDPAVAVDADEDATEVTVNGEEVTVDWEGNVGTFDHTPTTPGTQTVSVAFVPADADRYATPTTPAAASFEARTTQTLTGSVPTPRYANGTRTLTHALGHADPDAEVIATSATPDVCTVAGSLVTLKKAGACEIDLVVEETDQHLRATADVDFTVAVRPVTVTVTHLPTSPVYGGGVSISAGAVPLNQSTALSGSGTLTVTPVATAEDPTPDPILTEPYTFGATPPAVVLLADAEPGSYTVAVTFSPLAGQADVYGASTGSTPLTIGKGTQNVTLGSSTGHLYVGKTWATPARGAKSGTAATLSVTPPSGPTGPLPAVCEVVGTGPLGADGTDLRFLRAGTCRVTSTVAADDRYQLATRTDDLTVALRPVTVAVAAVAEDTTDLTPRYREPVVVTVTAKDGVPDGATAAPVAGTGTLRITPPSGPVVNTTITFDATGTARYEYTPQVRGSHQLRVSVTPAAVGGIDTYAAVALPSTAQGNFTVAQGRQPISWGALDASAPASSYLVDQTWQTNATGGPTGNTVVLSPSANCTVSGLVVTVKAAPPTSPTVPGTCTITATQAGNGNYLAGTRTEIFDVLPRPVSVTVSWPTGPSVKHVYQKPVTITATATDTTSGSPVPDPSQSVRSGTGLITVDGVDHAVTFRDGVATLEYTPQDVKRFPVTATFTAHRANAYAATSAAAVDLVVEKATPSGTLTPTVTKPTAPNAGDSWQPKVTGLGSGSPVEIDATPVGVCTVDTTPTTGGPIVRFAGVGTCTVVISQPGDRYYEDAQSTTVTVGVVRLATALTITPPAAAPYGQPRTVAFAATAVRAGTTIAGTVKVTVIDRTDSAVEQQVDLPYSGTGTATLDFPAGLLGGAYRVDATFVPTSTSTHESATDNAEFTVTLIPQVATLQPEQTIPTTRQVEQSWTPQFEQTASQEPVQLVVVEDDSESAPMDVYTKSTGVFYDPTFVLPPHSCTTDATHGTLVAVTAGPCTVQAIAPAVPRKYAASAPAFTREITVERIAQTLSLQPTSETHTVGSGVSLQAIAKVDQFAATGKGIMKVVDPEGEVTPTLPARDDEWFGGGRIFSFTPTMAGTYTAKASFQPTNRLKYQWAEESATFTVDPGSQRIVLTNQRPTRVLVGATWTPTATGGRSGEPVEVVVLSGSCSVVGGVVHFDAVGDCLLRLEQDGTDDYLPAELELDRIEMTQTGVSILAEMSDPQVGSPVSIVISAVGALDRRPVEGKGSVEVYLGDELVVDDQLDTRTRGVRTLTYKPDHAEVLRVVARFTPDTSSYEPNPTPADVSRTVERGPQWVRVGTDPTSPAFVGQTWAPDASAGGAPDAAVEVVSLTTDVCSVGSGSDGRPLVTYLAPDTCEIRTAVTDDPDWKPASRLDTIEVAAHPTTTTMATPVAVTGGPLRFGEEISLSAQVMGRPNNAGVPIGVPGTVQFTMDGVDLPNATAPILPTGWATKVVVIPRQIGFDPEVSVYPHVFGARFVPETAQRSYWSWSTTPVETPTPSQISRRTQLIERRPPPGGTLRVGQTWVSGATLSGTGAAPRMSISTADQEYCSLTGATVRVLKADATPRQCVLSYSQEADGEWDRAPDGEDPITIIRHPAVLALAVGTPAAPDRAVAGGTLPLKVTVTSPGVEATASTSAVPDSTPEGTVTFTVDGVALPPVTTTGGVASTTYSRVPEAGDLPVTATFTPAGGFATTHATGTAAGTVAVAKAVTSTDLVTVSATGLTAEVSRTTNPVPALGETVEFSWSEIKEPRTWTALGTSPVVGGRAVHDGAMPPADKAVEIRAVYRGDDHHLASTSAATSRLLPSIEASVSGSTTGWNSAPVTISFTCRAPATTTLVGGCPAPVVLSRDGSDLGWSQTVRASNGGEATATVGGIRIDRGAPTVRIQGPAAGATYRGTPPAAVCVGRDALSGVASCTITRQVLGDRARRDVAVVVDRAGNRSRTHLDYVVRQEWVVNAPLVGSGFQVKRGSRQRIIVRTEGPQPQLMLPNAKGRLRPAKVFSANRIENGIVTWYVDVVVPKRIRVGRAWTPGFRLADTPRQVSRIRLDVVRRPSARNRR